MKRLTAIVCLVLAGCGAQHGTAAHTVHGVRLYPERDCVIELGLRHGQFYHRCIWHTAYVTEPNDDPVTW